LIGKISDRLLTKFVIAGEILERFEKTNKKVYCNW